MPNDDTEPSGTFTPLEQSRLETLRAKVNAFRPKEERDRLLKFFHSHNLPNESARRLVPTSRYPAIIQEAEQILKDKKAEIAKERQRKVSPEEETSALRKEITTFTQDAVNKLASDLDAVHFEQASDQNPDTSWKEFVRVLQTSDGPLKLTGEIDPNNHFSLRLNYINIYFSPKEKSLMSAEVTFASSDMGIFIMTKDIENYDTGEVTQELLEFSLTDRKINKEAKEAVAHAENMLDIYLEEN